MKSDLTSASRFVLWAMVAALAVCAVAAWVTGKAIVLLPGMALLPGLAFMLSRRGSTGRE